MSRSVEVRPVGGRAFSAKTRAASAAIATSAALAGCSASPRAQLVSAADLCVDIPVEEQTHPSFLDARSIAAIGPAMGERRLLKSWTSEVRGAELHVRAQPGLTKQWIARVVRCHIALETENRAGNAAAPEDLLVEGLPSVSFDEDEEGFVVRLMGHDRQEGEAILARAKRLTALR
jgi:hypothetical protein